MKPGQCFDLAAGRGGGVRGQGVAVGVEPEGRDADSLRPSDVVNGVITDHGGLTCGASSQGQRMMEDVRVGLRQAHGVRDERVVERGFEAEQGDPLDVCRLKAVRDEN